MIYEGEHLYFLRKPAGVPSTRWKQKSFLDFLEEEDHHVVDIHHHHDAWNEDLHSYMQRHLSDIWAVQTSDIHGVAQSLLHMFSAHQEYGLLNRLDTLTSWFLYFAKDQQTYAAYRDWQHNWSVTKHYLAAVHGNPWYMLDHWTDEHGVEICDSHFHVSYPIMHHKHLDDRMHVVKEKYLLPKSWKWRGKTHQVTTTWRVVSYEQEANTTYLHLTIDRGARHQIRSHLAAIGYPIIGDPVYAKNTHHPLLHLWSIWCEIEQSNEVNEIEK